MKTIRTCLLLLALSLASGCVTTGTPQQQQLFVSVREAPLLARPDAFSQPLLTLGYGDVVTVERFVQVAPLAISPAPDLPKWVFARHGGVAGYLPLASLASEWLIKNQDQNARLDEMDAAVARRGFSEEEQADMVAMRGAAGAAVAGRPDYRALDRVLQAGQADQMTAGLAQDLAQNGGIATQGLAVHVHEATPENTAFAAGLMRSALDGVSWAVQSTQGLAQSMGITRQQADRAAYLAEVTSELAFKETGPLQEYQLGRAVSARLLGEFPLHCLDSEPARYLQAIGEIVARGSSAPFPYAGYRFVLLDDERVNAFAAPGGFVFVTSGMLSFLQTEDELAAILGHEIAHVELGHGMGAVDQNNLLALFGILGRMALDDATSGVRAPTQLSGMLREKAEELYAGIIAEMVGAIQRGYSREIESEADLRSIEISAALGYDTGALHALLERFREERGDYGGASYPQERGADALGHQRKVDPSHALTTSEERTRRYQDMLAKI